MGEIRSLEISDSIGNYYFFTLKKGERIDFVDLRFTNDEIMVKNELGQELRFFLSPKMKYQIINDTYGGAAPEVIEFTTDAFRHIDYVSRLTCN